MLQAARLAVFHGLERLSRLHQTLRGRSTRRVDIPDAPAKALPFTGPSLWIFVPTIGELNLAAPLLDELRRRWPTVPLTLVSDRAIYRDAYQRRYPDALVQCCEGAPPDIEALTRRSAPLALLVIEIPCLPWDAPCALPYDFLRRVKSLGAPIALLNAWCYGYQAPSRLARVERRWFSASFVRSFNLITVQTEGIRRALLEAGASPERVHVTGNMKFDAVVAHPAAATGRHSAALLEALATCSRPIVVAGCVTDVKDQDNLLDAFNRFRRHAGDALLILVPRHPENQPRMSRLQDALTERSLPCVFRTTHGDRPIPPDIVCLVLDTFGELPAFYAIGTLCFVGRNHNLLEPLGLCKPTSTMGFWEPGFPSYPVYHALREANAIDEADTPAELGDLWIHRYESLRRGSGHTPQRPDARALIAALAGATARNLELLETSGITRRFEAQGPGTSHSSSA